MSNKLLVPFQQSSGWDVLCVSGEEECPFSSSSGISFSSSSSPCQVSSSSVNQRSPSRKKSKEGTKEEAGAHPINNDFGCEDGRSTQEEQVDSAGTMGYDTTNSYRSRNTHRRVSSPHPDGNVRKSNKPQMERRRRQRINDSVNELRKCISEVFKVDPSRHDKLEKADILELTVKYFHFIQSKCSTKDWNSENKPIRFENKKISDEYSISDRFENGTNDLRYSNVNEQPVTFIIQTLPQNFQNQFGLREQCFVGLNGNSVAAQPPVLPSHSPPVIQLNITNNITNPNLESVPCIPSSQLSCHPENACTSSISPDTTTREMHHENPKDCFISYQDDINQYGGFIGEQNYITVDKSQLHHQKKVMSINRETLNAKRISMGRPIAPKPPRKPANIIQMNALPQINPIDQQEQVWRPWDANRKILKPHMVR